MPLRRPSAWFLWGACSHPQLRVHVTFFLSQVCEIHTEAYAHEIEQIAHRIGESSSRSVVHDRKSL